ncbi:unnamed protein product [Didymodactylos carnosus]|uniref:Uncharacterized protein n=1 Tax=Didymodactylos carnosus TaxID=1234261 RepID=A0A814DR25_9BILA|nr:unnamed protein product [Didymodactylos carnosus]CAF1481304.1 unnamed protein product [Didymodactylos carnosus]CAF3733838.1 unnamed protein product [Didymodactylos carnosus]CAF4271764.1 unnamed protein product [Didymodactylos carnosus]
MQQIELILLLVVSPHLIGNVVFAKQEPFVTPHTCITDCEIKQHSFTDELDLSTQCNERANHTNCRVRLIIDYTAQTTDIMFEPNDDNADIISVRSISTAVWCNVKKIQTTIDYMCSHSHECEIKFVREALRNFTQLNHEPFRVKLTSVLYDNNSTKPWLCYDKSMTPITCNTRPCYAKLKNQARSCGTTLLGVDFTSIGLLIVQRESVPGVPGENETQYAYLCNKNYCNGNVTDEDVEQLLTSDFTWTPLLATNDSWRKGMVSYYFLLWFILINNIQGLLFENAKHLQ